jgi:antitoxin component YwqK of YwqJK toxin-antitoxin module
MKNLLFLVGLLMSISCIAQINQVDNQGRKQGQWEKTFPKSSALEYTGSFVDDKPVGTFTYFYPSTKVRAIIKHNPENGRSEAFFYHENKRLMTYGNYKNYKKDSLWLYYGPSGRISYTENYFGDSLHGIKTIYFVPELLEDKSIRKSREMNYNMGKLDGAYNEWFDNGNKRSSGTYENNIVVGIWEDYHTNGRKMNLIRYKKGLKHGWSVVYNEMGKEIHKVYYYQGQEKSGKDLEFLFKQMKEKGVNPNE